MRFLVAEQEFDFGFENQNQTLETETTINSNTSVNEVKIHFFETLKTFGEIIKVGNNIDSNELKKICKLDDILYACFHEEPPHGIACRLLSHTKGSLMLTGGFLNRWTFMDTTMNIVTSHQQANQLKTKLGKAAPQLSVFVSQMNIDDYRLPTNNERNLAREFFKVQKQQYHIIFGGRFIANKGICQLVRALNLCPEKNIRLTLVGNFEEDFIIYQSNATHATFPEFFQREILGKNKNVELVCLPSMRPEGLRDLFWSADCFAFPSFHEDEAIGTTPRLAMLCGVPVVATDFSGFGQLSKTNTGLLKTYATLGGVRFSLKQLHLEINKIRCWKSAEKQVKIRSNVDWLLDFCDPERSKIELKNAAEYLIKIPVNEAPEGGWRSKQRFDRWINNAPKGFHEAVAMADQKQPKDLFVDGTGFVGSGWFSEPYFLKAIQEIYTTLPEVPKAKKNITYRGFWRIGLWVEENAIVEFGFPGPRVFRLSPNEFWNLKECGFQTHLGEVAFLPKKASQLILIQKLIDLGCIVPDEF
jgi:glycosyltransferase involved in cell wall biosynthesis